MSQEQAVTKKAQQEFSQLTNWSTEAFDWGSFNFSRQAERAFGVLPLIHDMSWPAAQTRPRPVPDTAKFPETHIWLLTPEEYAAIDSQRDADVSMKVEDGLFTANVTRPGAMLLGITFNGFQRRVPSQDTHYEHALYMLGRENDRKQEIVADKLQHLVWSSLTRAVAHKRSLEPNRASLNYVKNAFLGAVVAQALIASEIGSPLDSRNVIAGISAGSFAAGEAIFRAKAAHGRRSVIKTIKDDVYTVFSPDCLDDDLRRIELPPFVPKPSSD